MSKRKHSKKIKQLQPPETSREVCPCSKNQTTYVPSVSFKHGSVHGGVGRGDPGGRGEFRPELGKEVNSVPCGLTERITFLPPWLRS